jgi:hypothetical protein
MFILAYVIAPTSYVNGENEGDAQSWLIPVIEPCRTARIWTIQTQKSWVLMPAVREMFVRV